AGSRAVDRRAVDDEAEHARLVDELVVAEERRLARRAELAVDAHVGDRALARLRVLLRALALSAHEAVEGVAVDAEPGLLRDLEREVDREAVRVVQQEGLVAAQRALALALRLLDGRVQDRRSRRERAQEGLLLPE